MEFFRSQARNGIDLSLALGQDYRGIEKVLSSLYDDSYVPELDLSWIDLSLIKRD